MFNWCYLVSGWTRCHGPWSTCSHWPLIVTVVFFPGCGLSLLTACTEARLLDMSSTDFTVGCHCRFPAYCLSVRLAVCWPMACHCLTECPQSQSSVTGWHATLTGLRASAHAMTMNGQLACCEAELWLGATAAAAWQCVYSDSHCGERLTRNSYILTCAWQRVLQWQTMGNGHWQLDQPLSVTASKVW